MGDILFLSSINDDLPKFTWEYSDNCDRDGLFPLGNGRYLTPAVLTWLRACGVELVQGLSPEQLEVAQLEAELEQARADGIIDEYHFQQHECSGVGYQLYYGSPQDDRTCHGNTRIEAARAAVTKAHELRAEAERKRLPEPEEMTAQQCCEEMKALGYMLQLAVPTMKYNAPFGLLDIREECDEVPSEFHRRALRTARAAKQQ